jgi:hypothetical protein
VGKKKLNLELKYNTDVKVSEDILASSDHSSIRFDEKEEEFLIEGATIKFDT